MPRRNPASPNSCKPTDHGAGIPSGRLYIVVLVAAVAAFFVVPVAQAAAGTAKVSIAGFGSGKVKEMTPYTSSEPAPINCPSVCTGTITNEEFIALAAIPSAGSKFIGWTLTKGSAGLYCDGSKEEIEAAKGFGEEFPEYAGAEGECFAEDVGGVEITATFDSSGGAPLTIVKLGEGTVVSNPPGIECTGAKTGTECIDEFGGNELVELIASPATDYAFSAWAGCTEHVGLTCKVKMDKAKAIMVTFVKTPLLTVEKAGSGYGKVTAMGISCDENCMKATSAIKVGNSVTVKAIPAKGSEAAVFEGGTGSAGGCSGAVCTFTIEANSSVKVKFDPKPTKTLTVNLTGPGAFKGKVSGKGIAKGLYGSTINCGAGCTTQTESFFAIDTATLTATAAPGYTFAGWSGSGCSGTGTCTVATSSDKTVEAEFE